ncbi:E3 ubiquitin-protein ligase Ubr3-like, partial [Cydia pomonella]|uniref:E3 ubiquitin-protein ligase Ubr3-like n=1 Tax=Cydia pomonella TaxID=82600 RepID=UPI002ADE76CE
MSISTAQVLMKKGKRGAAAYISADCASGSPQHLGPLLDVLLNPSKAIDEWETIDWCRWLLAGGRTPDEFAAVVRSYDKHDKCGLVWIPRVVAYRCRTCGISPCMSICRECFHRGDHSTHDFNMFLSQAGGACDCGDNSVMKEDGWVTVDKCICPCMLICRECFHRGDHSTHDFNMFLSQAGGACDCGDNSVMKEDGWVTVDKCICPCMLICRECFHRGDHSTHDFNMFLSQAGGACDCGDNSVMKEDGWVTVDKCICPCMLICRECFHRGDHSTHDFNMFLSQAGGACDCGDNSVMKEDGWVTVDKCICPCMLICRECFHRGDHSTHDFNMFLSQAGGACDCGDNSVMKEDGWVTVDKCICPCMLICRECFHRGDHSTHDFNMFLSQAGGACDCGDNSVMKEDGWVTVDKCICPCMLICRECFHRGDHSTHDFNMFLSQAGGACDCGDNSVMKEDGFCSNHGNKCPRPGTAPAELMCVAEAMMPRLILRLLQHFRENSDQPSGQAQPTSNSYRIAVQECEGYVQMLMEFNNMGDLMRSAMTKALINPQMYRNLVEPPFPETEYGCYMAESNRTYEKALDSFPAPEYFPDEYRHLPALAPRLSHNTLLDEFIFWTFKYEFPQNVVCFLLNMLPDQDYKEHLTRTFVMHYARIPLVLEAAGDPDMLSNRVVHMSVQLFSNEALALRCVQQLHLLHVMVLSLKLMMGKILVQNTLHDPEKNTHKVIDCTRRVMKEHCYWPLVSDFNNVLSHKSVALVFLQDDALVEMWFQFLSMLQGMNVNVRETDGHIEFEPSSYYAAFSCELEAAAYPMWSVLSHLTSPQHAPLAKRIVAAAANCLQEWLDEMQCTTPRALQAGTMHASFHFPLHRYLAAFLCSCVRTLGVSAADVLPPPRVLALLAHHPLRVQVSVCTATWPRSCAAACAPSACRRRTCCPRPECWPYLLTTRSGSSCVRTLGVSAADVLPPPRVLALLAHHPLRVQVSVCTATWPRSCAAACAPSACRRRTCCPRPECWPYLLTTRSGSRSVSAPLPGRVPVQLRAHPRRVGGGRAAPAQSAGLTCSPPAPGPGQCLHRYLAAFLCSCVRTLGVSAADVLPPPRVLALLAHHPLRVQVSVCTATWPRSCAAACAPSACRRRTCCPRPECWPYLLTTRSGSRSVSAPLPGRVPVQLRAHPRRVGGGRAAPAQSAGLTCSPPAPGPGQCLHRYLAAFLCSCVRTLGVSAADVLPPPRVLALLAHHPLRVQSLFYEILAGIWVRNGLQIKGQAMTYIQANFCNSMVDMDIYWLQICAAHLPADQFLDMCIDMFGVREWLSMVPMPPVQAAEQDAMVEGLLTFLAILVSSRTNLGNDELTQSRLEVSTLLAAGDKTHSQLLELMPERSGNAHTRNFEVVLKELSTYRPPPRGSENLEQGLFVPTPLVWQKYYDPLHVLRRAVHRRDFHASMERFTAYVREKQKASGQASTSKPGEGAALWPPLRPAAAPPPEAGDPRAICASGVLHGALLAVLHRGVHRRAPDASAPHAPPDHVLALAVYLLDVAAQLAAERASDHDLDVMVAGGEGGSRGAAVSGRPLLGALGGALPDNARTVVARLPPPRAPAPRPGPVYPHHCHSDSDTEWEPTETESARISPMKSALLSAMSTALAVPPNLDMVPNSAEPVDADDQSDGGGDATPIRALESGSISSAAEGSRALALPMPMSGTDTDMADDMSLALNERESSPPASIPIEYDVSTPEWSVSLREPSPPPALPCAAPRPSANTQVQLHTGTDDSIPVNESIISLLLKLHSQLSGRLDSFSLEEPEPAADEPIGDGPHFIGQVLRKLARLDARCAGAIAHVRHSLWPHQRERQAEQRARERREKEERSRRARERQQQMMKEFQRRQQQFLSAMQRMDPEPMDLDADADYDCVICNTSSVSTPQHPIGRVVLLQSTSVLGHRRRQDSGGARLALSERERARLAEQRDTTAAAHHYRLHDELQQHFDQEAWLLSVSVGLEGGVHVASCGHHLHVRCLAAYLRSLAAPARPHNLHVAGGEFLCPVCRQLANRYLTRVAAWLLSVSVGLEGGVHVASCGHHLHVRCLAAYLRSLAAPARPHNLHVAGGEFLCPVCRQLANRYLTRVAAWLLSVSVGLEGGVHVASCGHHLHVRCLAAYLRSLAAPARPHNLHVAGGEFLCPVCRQLANRYLTRVAAWLLSVSVGLEGGVHVASCGHHLHVRCLAAYLRSLAAPARPHNLHVAGGEFLCPVCRQLANRYLTRVAAWLLSVSVGLEGGVHVASCGHHLHVRCLAAYLRSLAAPAR